MNAAQLPLMAGVLVVLAIGVMSAAPGISLAPGASAPTAPSCPLHLTLNVLPQVGIGAPVPVSAAATTHSGCWLTVAHYAFTGVPGWSGTVVTSHSVILAYPGTVGTFEITVTVMTNLGSLSATATMQVV